MEVWSKHYCQQKIFSSDLGGKMVEGIFGKFKIYFHVDWEIEEAM